MRQAIMTQPGKIEFKDVPRPTLKPYVARISTSTTACILTPTI